MKTHRWLFALAFLTGLTGSMPAGCGAGGDPCENSCERQKSCNDGTVDPNEDCVASCSESREEAEMIGCLEQYDDSAACLDGIKDICSYDPETSSECQGEFLSLALCAFANLPDLPTDTSDPNEPTG